MAATAVKVAEPEMLPEVAVIVETPAPPALAKPPTLIVATDVTVELQVTDAVISAVVASV